MKIDIAATFLSAAAFSVSHVSAEISYQYVEGPHVSAVVDTEDEVFTAPFQLAPAIAAPGSKDLILMLSSEINMVTDTVARDGNKNGKTTAVAETEVTATMKYCVECQDISAMDICAGGAGIYEAFPQGGIKFAARTQELSVDVDLDCDITNDASFDCEITGYVEVGLKLDTTAAHTFNFIADLQNTGTGSTNKPVRTVACFDLSADAEVLTDGGDASGGSARGYVGLQSTMLIVQEASVSNINNPEPPARALRAQE